MKHLVRLFAATAVAAVLATGCSVYHPQAVDIPLINHRGDTRLDASLSLSTLVLPDAVCANVTASHGFNDWLTGQVHFNFGGDNYYAQAAPGAYFPLGEKSVFETYFGVGYGGASRDNATGSDSVAHYDFHGHYTLPFVQGNIGWHDLTGINIDLALGVKVGAFLPDYSYTHYNAAGDVTSNEVYNQPTFLFEPQAMLRFGSENLKLSLRVGMVYLDDVSESSRYMVHDLLTFSAGLAFTF